MRSAHSFARCSPISDDVRESITAFAKGAAHR
jgi:hypothetical protein